MTPAEYALLNADGVVIDVIVVDEDSADSRTVLDALVATKTGPHAPVTAHERIDKRRAGYSVPAIGRKKRADGTWKSDEYLARHAAGRREHREGDERGKPTGRILDENGEPRKGSELPETSGRPETQPAGARPAP